MPYTRMILVVWTYSNTLSRCGELLGYVLEVKRTLFAGAMQFISDNLEEFGGCHMI